MCLWNNENMNGGAYRNINIINAEMHILCEYGKYCNLPYLIQPSLGSISSTLNLRFLNTKNFAECP